MKKTFEDYGINLYGKTSGQTKTYCPKCKERKGHQPETKDLSVDITGGKWNCKSGNCNWKGMLEENINKPITKNYILPTWKNNTDISDTVVKYCEDRGISQFTLRQLKITSGKKHSSKLNKSFETIEFNYFKDETLINIKHRGCPDKMFQLEKDAQLIMYNLNGIKDTKECIITEGEFDALSYWESGLHNVVSVPNGAGLSNNNFQYLDDCYEYFEKKEKIYIASDNDTAGIVLRNELVRRFGAYRCFVVEYGEYKDANDLLKAEGKEAVKNSITNAKEIKEDGIFTVEDVYEDMSYGFEHGEERGTSTYIQTFDPCWTHKPGEVTVWTGYMNEGKSNLVSQIAVLKAEKDDFKYAVFCPENYPIKDYYNDLVHCLVGKSTDPFFSNQMSRNEYDTARSFIDKHFFVIDPEDDYTIETIIEKAKYLVFRKGINGLIIDPYNQIDHQIPSGQREDLYISRFMAKLKRESIKMGIETHLVAHQLTPNFSGKEDYPQPDPYKIKGGGTFADKADNVIVVWRQFRKSDRNNPIVKIIVAKVKKQRLVGIPGDFDLYYSRKQNQYFETPEMTREIHRISEPMQSNLDFDNENDGEPAPF